MLIPPAPLPPASEDEFVLRRLEAAPAVRWAEVFRERRGLRRIRSDRNGLRILAEEWDAGAAVRIVGAGGEIRQASGTGWHEAVVLDAARTLHEGSTSPPRPPGSFTRLSGVLEAAPDTWSAAATEWLGGGTAEIARWVESLEAALPGHPSTVDITLSIQGVSHRSTDSPLVVDVRTGILARLEIPTAGGVVRRRWAGEAPADFRSTFDQGGSAARLEEACRRQAEAGPAPGGVFPVILAAGTAGLLLHEAVGHFLEGDQVAGARLGGSVSPLLTVRDGGRLLTGRGAYRWDDEGSPAGSALFVEAGRVAGRVGDRWNAPPTTGHARRQTHRDPPLPRMAGTLCEAGPHDPGEILREVTRGVWVSDVASGWADSSSGEVLLHVSDGRLIEGGRLTMPTREFVLATRAAEALSLIDRLGSDVESNGGAHSCVRGGQAIAAIVGAPTLRIAAMRVHPMESS